MGRNGMENMESGGMRKYGMGLYGMTGMNG